MVGLNKQKGNMYGFVTHTWNVVKGACLHNCEYCYMKRFKQNLLHIDYKEFKADLGENNFIFVGSSCDMFAKDVDDEDILQVLDHCKKFDNKYLFQSKNPRRMLMFENNIPENSILATTIETNKEGFNYNAPTILERIDAIKKSHLKTMITIEPIIDFDLNEFIELIRSVKPFMVSVGANTSSDIKLKEPSGKKVLELIEELKKFTKVIIKPNLTRIIGK